MYLTADPIDLGALLAVVQSPRHGGVASFLGCVRDHQAGRAVLRLEYSAYNPMAEAECGRIVGEAESKWDCIVALKHRTGTLQIGDVAVAIVAASAHRDEAFAACRYVIEELKRRGALWEREGVVGGAGGWGGRGGAGEEGRGGGGGGGSSS